MTKQHPEEYTLTATQHAFCSAHIPFYSAPTFKAVIAGKAGSDRQFVRVYNASLPRQSWILVLWNRSDQDWDRFFAINHEVRSQVPVLPAIFAVDEEHGFILEEDCGTTTLKDLVMSATTDTVRIKQWYFQAIEKLIEWQHLNLQPGMELTSRALDAEVFLWETCYFSEHCIAQYLQLSELLTSQWETECQWLAQHAAAMPRVCLHRDFQSENIMISTSSIKFVDFQGARLGAASYDLASLLLDPYIDVLDQRLITELLSFYRDKSSYTISDHDFCIAAVQRLSQACGAYANLALNKGKKKYLSYIPSALERMLRYVSQCEHLTYYQHVVSQCLKNVPKT